MSVRPIAGITLLVAATVVIWLIKSPSVPDSPDGNHNGNLPDVIIAVLDTGIDRNHEDLVARVINEVNLSDSPVVNDLHGHGTHITGIIAANVDNGIGINGVAPNALIMNVKVTDDRGRCDAANIANGILWAVNNGADILNISLQLDEPSLELAEAVVYAWNNNVPIIAAAGSNVGSAPQYPAYYLECISVTAVKDDGTYAPLANRGAWVDLKAPGYEIYSLLPNNEYGCKTGTSQATAFVTGLAATLYPTFNGDRYSKDKLLMAISETLSNYGRE